MTRTKEKFDPSNMLSSMFGKKNESGKNSKSAIQGLLGMGDDGYFGNYGKKGKNKKDPRRTTIGKGPIRALKMGDSTADILAKMYNFMQKTNETFRTNYEIDKKFREEQLEEDARRHKKLIESLTSNKTKKLEPPKKEEEEGEPSWIGKMLGAMKKALGGLFAVLSAPLSGIFGLLKLVGGLVFGALGTIAATILGVIGGNALTIVGLLVKPLLSLIGSSITAVIRSVLGSAAGGIAAAVLGVAYGAFKSTQSKEDLQFGPDFDELTTRQAEEEIRRFGETTSATRTKAQQEEFIKMKAKHKIEKEEAIANYEDITLTPKMREAGFEPMDGPNGRHENGARKYKNKEGKIADLGDYTEILKKMTSMEATIQKIMFGNIKPMEERLADLIKEVKEKTTKAIKEDVIPGITNPLKDLYKNEIVPAYTKAELDVPSFEDFLKKFLPEEYLEGVTQNISVNESVNTVKEKPEIVDGNPLTVRNNNPSVNKSTRGLTATW
jgi:hypothetical protein